MSAEQQQIGPYRLQQRLGYGSLGEVYLVTDTRSNRQNALKLLRASATTSAQEVRFFEGEAKTISQFNHPHILPLLDYGETTLDGAQVPYVVTPFCPDGTLVAWLRQNSNAGIVPPQDVASIVQQGAEALQYAHNYGIVHQDIKPSNFFLRSRTAGVPDLWVGDFGLGQITRDEGDANQAVRGTPTYIAPEQWAGQPVPATDQYALAVMAYQMLTGQSPFQGNREQLKYAHNNLWPSPPSTANSALPHEIDGVLLRALAKSPGERFSSITAFANALQQALPASASAPGQGPVVLPLANNVSNDPFYNDATVASNVVRPAQPAQPAVQPLPPFPPPQNDIPPLAPAMQQSTFPPNDPQRRSTNTTLIVLTIALVAVLLIGSVILFSVLRGGNTGALPPAAATATAITNATATGQVNSQTATASSSNATATATAEGAQNSATATAQANNANATATAQANGQANANATATAQANGQANATATATTLTQFNGNWVNDDSGQTKGVSRLNITNNGTTISVQAFGKCGASDCLWGTQTTLFTTPQIIVNYTLNTGSLEALTISLNNPNQLKVVEVSPTNGNATYTFHKT
ncbi:MAG: serine/threonine protein kinase [Chloroflexota bacterium]|nr:serine/threonine protein kinase [Chloroflexota bacterium]